MKFYKLKALSVGSKGNRVLRKEDNKTYPENTWHEKRADELVKLGFLVLVKDASPKVEPKVKSDPEKEKPEDEESSLLEGIKKASGEESENEDTKEISEDDERKALLKEAKKLAKSKDIKAPHYLSGIEKIKSFINDNK